MFCPNCGTEIPNESLFCGTCGYRLMDNQGAQQMSQDVQQPQPEYGGQYVQQPQQAYAYQNAQQPQQMYNNQYVQQPQQMYNNQYVQQPQQAYDYQYAQQYAGAPVSHKKRNIIIISSVAAALVITLTIVLILVLGNKSFEGKWKFGGFIDENYEVLDFDELEEIVVPKRFEEARSEYANLVIVINDDGTAQISLGERIKNGHWRKISDNTIELEGEKLTLEDGHLSLYPRSALKIEKKDGNGKLKLIGVVFE